MKPRRIAILGGGCGGVAAAWELSRTPELRRRFSVTLYQSGWRLGGKGATGRDPDRGHAVLEHGLHMWLGFYRQAFEMVRDIYANWDGPASGPQSSLEAAFSPMHDVALAGGTSLQPDVWRLKFPELSGRPWDPSEQSPLRWMSVAAAWGRQLRAALVNGPDGRWTTKRLGVLAGLVAAVAKGLGAELPRHGADIWAKMDEEDLRAWLRRHGASAAQADSPIIGGLYDLGFAYPDRDPGPGRGAMAAGAGLRVLLRTFGAYRGAPFWRMNAGMGDTVFAPAWEVLRQRGVDIQLFHHVRKLRVRDGGIGRVEFGVQADQPEAYDPILRVGEVRAWPDRPLVQSSTKFAEGDLESDVAPAIRTRVIDRGEDFDDVVLAIPSTGHHHFASEVMAENPDYREMVERTTAVPTIAAQFWLDRGLGQLGFRGAPPVLTGMRGLFRTWADMTPILDAEDWTRRPRSLAYFCSVAPRGLDACEGREAAAEWVANEMREWADGPLLEHWPAAKGPGGGFDETALHGPEGRSRWLTQYARANVRDWERYVLSLPGETKYRLAPDQSGLSNLFLAGDWTRTEINGGSVEAAVSSGLSAAQAITRRA